MTNNRPEGSHIYGSRGGGGYPFSSRESDDGDGYCPVLEVPSMATTQRDTSHRSRCGNGGGGARETGGAGDGGRSSADGWPNGMSDMVRF